MGAVEVRRCSIGIRAPERKAQDGRDRKLPQLALPS